MILKGRCIVEGDVIGEVVKFSDPIVILGDINEKEGKILDRDIKGKIVVFPRGAGSTVGSYTIYGLKYYGTAPKAFILQEAETIVAAGAIMANIPTVDKIDISQIKDGAKVRIKGNIVELL
jgi:predicted aconitase with swiveling domain